MSHNFRKRKYLSGATKLRKKIMREYEMTKLLNPFEKFFSNMDQSSPDHYMEEPINLDTLQLDLLAEPTNLDTLQSDLLAEPTNLDTLQPDLLAEPTNLDTLQPDLLAKPTNSHCSQFGEKNKHTRNFQTTWLHQFPWIELSMDRTKVFCSLCKWAFQSKLLGLGVRVENTWTTTGYSNFRKALGKNGGFKTHEKSECHHRSAVLYNCDNLQ